MVIELQQAGMKKGAGKGDRRWEGLDVGVYLMCLWNTEGVCVPRNQEGCVCPEIKRVEREIGKKEGLRWARIQVIEFVGQSKDFESYSKSVIEGWHNSVST